jgi:IS30 family transposase
MEYMNYRHLSIVEREKIQELLWAKQSIRSIAGILGRSPSSVSREISKNIPLKRTYRPRIANERALTQRHSRGRTLRLKSGFIRRYVVSHLKEGLSPAQVAGRLHVDYPAYSISHEAIYQYIYAQTRRNGQGGMRPGYHDLRRYLKRRHKLRQKKGERRYQRLTRPDGMSIDNRPKEVAQRRIPGHWEGDSMVSRKSTVGLNTLVERKTGMVFISRIANGTAQETSTHVCRRLLVLPPRLRLSLTLDNGSENAGHRTIKERLGTSVYYAHPYHSWERGTNENTNGLIRWYLPKGTDFATVSDEEIARIEWALNNRPRKRLGWRTPLEVWSVALQG